MTTHGAGIRRIAWFLLCMRIWRPRDTFSWPRDAMPKWSHSHVRNGSLRLCRVRDMHDVGKGSEFLSIKLLPREVVPETGADAQEPASVEGWTSADSGYCFRYIDPQGLFACHDI